MDVFVQSVRLSLGIALCLLIFADVSKAEAPDDREVALLTGHRVAEWQLSQMRDFSYVRTFQEETANPRGWIQASFFIGLNRWYQATGAPIYRDHVEALGQSNQWQLGDRPWHADDQAIAQVYLALTDDATAYRSSHARAAFDAILDDPPTNDLEFTKGTPGVSEGGCQRRWCWSDALFMSPPAWAALSAQTGDPRYANYALKEYAAVMDVLYDPEEHLFFRDTRFIGKRGSDGQKIFWSRGNGWVFAGLPLLIEELPENHPDRAWLLDLFRQLAHRLTDLQNSQGLWAPSLLNNEPTPPVETSGSAFILFGLTWGLNNEILAAEDVREAVLDGWNALSAQIQASGKLGFVQQVGTGPNKVEAGDTQLYGVGAFLLAASEIVRLD